MQKALQLKPDFAEAHYNLGHAIFLVGDDYKKAWLQYEYRFKSLNKKIVPHAKPSIPKWQGEPLNPNEKLLVVTEQGLGDTIQFMRYIPYLKEQGIDVSFCAKTKLHDLIKASGIISKPLTPEQGNEVKEGKWISLLSVPQFLDVSPDNPVITEPYIHSSIEQNTKWRNLLSKEKKTIVGINWQGNPNTEKRLRGRSFPLKIFSSGTMPFSLLNMKLFGSLFADLELVKAVHPNCLTVFAKKLPLKPHPKIKNLFLFPSEFAKFFIRR